MTTLADPLPTRVDPPIRRPVPRPGRRRSALAGAALLAGLAAAALLAPLLPIADPLATDWSAIRQPPSSGHWFGTDELGRDVLARTVWAGRSSLPAAVVPVALAAAVGVPLGVLAGHLGGWTDALVSRVSEALQAIPFMILAIGLAAFLGPSLGHAMLAIAIAMTPAFLRLARARAIELEAADFVRAARALGVGEAAIIRRHVLPNAAPTLIVQASIAGAAAVGAEATLGFLGLGQQPPAPSWGEMLRSGLHFLEQAPWMTVFPGLAVVLAVLGFTLLGDGLRDALDPRHRGSDRREVRP